MTLTYAIISGLAGLVFGGTAIAFIMRERLRHAAASATIKADETIVQLTERLAQREARFAEVTAEIERNSSELLKLREEATRLAATLHGEQKASAEKAALLTEAQQRLSDAFKALSADALRNNNQSFLELAKGEFAKVKIEAVGDLEKRQQAIGQLVQPVRESLDKFDAKILELEKARSGAYEGLTQQVKMLMETQEILRTEATNLVKALGTPRIRGRWGEIQLRRVVELAGMLNYCDFLEQESATLDDGTRLRPDLVVKLPGGKSIVVDAKAPLAGYLEALETNDEAVRLARMDDHARHIREHMSSLSKKSYWNQFSPAPEFVVLFLPGENFFSAALQHAPELIELGVDGRVILATPTTLIALLKAVAYGWRQERLAENAQQISDLGKELYSRLATMSGHLTAVGSKLTGAVESYNSAIGAFESRVLVSARRFKELDSTGTEKEIEAVDPIDRTVRLIDKS